MTKETQTAAVIEPQPDSMIAVIERAAFSPDVDIDKMERLLAMKERLDASAAEKAFNDAMVACQKEMPFIKADATNNQTNSKYAKLDNINKVIKPIYASHGFNLSFGTADSPHEGYIRVICDVSHTEGHTKQYFYDCPPDDVGLKGSKNKTMVHAHASASSYSQRYLVKMIFNLIIVGEDDDGNAAGGDTRSAMEIKQEAIEYMDLVKEHWHSIHAIKQALFEENYEFAVECYAELAQNIRKGLSKAPTKGGVFTIEERKKMASEAWIEARKLYGGFGDDPTEGQPLPSMMKN